MTSKTISLQIVAQNEELNIGDCIKIGLFADEIIVLDKGHLAELGSHDELLALKGIYKKLHDIQFGGIRSK